MEEERMSSVENVGGKPIALEAADQERLSGKIVGLLRAARGSAGEQLVTTNQQLAHQIMNAVNQVLDERTLARAPRSKQALSDMISSLGLLRPAAGDRAGAPMRDRCLFAIGASMLVDPTEIRSLTEIAIQNPGWLGLKSNALQKDVITTLIRMVERMHRDGELPEGAANAWGNVLPALRSQLGR
jgi:hypothetical protein